MQYSVRSASFPTRINKGLPNPMLKRSTLKPSFLATQ